MGGNDIILNPYLLQVNHVGKSVILHDSGYRINGSTLVISKFINYTWLHELVGISGEASASCYFDINTGTNLLGYKFAWTLNFCLRTSLSLTICFEGVFTICFECVFSFLSDRDPNLLKTLDVYDGTGDFLRKLEMDDDTLRKAIVLALRDDSYQLLDDKGYSGCVLLLTHFLFCRSLV